MEAPNMLASQHIPWMNATYGGLAILTTPGVDDVTNPIQTSDYLNASHRNKAFTGRKHSLDWLYPLKREFRSYEGYDHPKDEYLIGMSTS